MVKLKNALIQYMDNIIPRYNLVSGLSQTEYK